MRGLYIHIPFCQSICYYCDFVKRIPKNNDQIDNYLKALVKEIYSYKKYFQSIETIYIGGGTPSMLNDGQLKNLLKSLLGIKPIEFTIEVNPESYSEEKGLLFKKYGINRVSLGVQTFNEKLLMTLSRKHTKKQVFDCVENLKKIGIKSISIDLIYAVPGQRLSELEEDLDCIDQLKIEHVSCYSMILEKKTYFHHLHRSGKLTLVDQDTEALMFEKTIRTLKEQGFKHYEISNFSKNQKQSIHNLLYWTLGEYIGVGLGAHGFIDGSRTYNHHKLLKYLETPLEEKIFQTKEMMLQDELIFGLRKISGISIPKIKEKYGIDLLDKYPELLKKKDEGLIDIKGDRLMLTKKGIFLGNQVFMVFI